MKILIVLILVLFFAALWDWKKGKVPNLLIVVGALYGLMRIFYYHNLHEHICGIVFPILVLYPFYKIGTIGAADLKLFSMIGFYISFMENVYCIFLTFVIGAIISLIRMKRAGNFTDRISYLLSYLKECFNQKQFHYYYQNFNENKHHDEEIERTQIHLAIPIFMSVLIHFGGGIL